MTTEREVRGGIPAEIRAGKDGIKVAGYASVFNEVTDIGGAFREVIVPGAFRAAIKRDDVVFLINHEGLPLARTRSGTLKLEEDEKGLRVESTLDASDPDVQRVVSKMQRGDLDKMSFAFRALKQKWDETTEPPTRTIEEVELFDVSVVTSPAYEGTSIALRSLDEARKDQKRKNFNAAARRRRMKVTLDLHMRSGSKA